MKELDKKLIIDNWFWRVFQTYFETNWRTWNVITMSTKKSWEWVSIMALTKDLKIIYLEEFVFWPWETQILFPGWILENNTNHEETVNNELLEETWYKAGKVIFMWKYNQHNYISWKNNLFLCLDCEKVAEQELKDIEEIKVVLKDLSEFEKIVGENKLPSSVNELLYRKTKELTNNFTNFNL